MTTRPTMSKRKITLQFYCPHCRLFAQAVVQRGSTWACAQCHTQTERRFKIPSELVTVTESYGGVVVYDEITTRKSGETRPAGWREKQSNGGRPKKEVRA